MMMDSNTPIFKSKDGFKDSNMNNLVTSDQISFRRKTEFDPE